MLLANKYLGPCFGMFWDVQRFLFIACLDYQKAVSVGSGPRLSDWDLSLQCDGHILVAAG